MVHDNTINHAHVLGLISLQSRRYSQVVILLMWECEIDTEFSFSFILRFTKKYALSTCCTLKPHWNNYCWLCDRLIVDLHWSAQGLQCWHAVLHNRCCLWSSGEYVASKQLTRLPLSRKHVGFLILYEGHATVDKNTMSHLNFNRRQMKDGTNGTSTAACLSPFHSPWCTVAVLHSCCSSWHLCFDRVHRSLLPG